MLGRLLRATVVIAVIAVVPASAASKDPAARGLDLFLHAPKTVPSGATLPVQVRVFGFPTVSTLTPLAGAAVEAAWDPESLGEKVATAPKPVEITCDDAGRGHLEIAVPPGRSTLKLLVSARWQGHERTRTLEVERAQRHELDLRVSDTDVVPGGNVSAWVVLRDRVTGQPAGAKSVDLALKEGSVERFSRRLVTDHAGTASTEVPIPLVEDPEWKWNLSARTAVGHGDEAEATVTLGVREETPQAPSMRAHWRASSVPPGAKASFVAEVRDGTGRGIPNQSLRYWVGQRGLQAPKDDKAWLAASTKIHTDADGLATATVETPKTISPRGSTLALVTKTLVEGHPLSGQDTLTLATPVPELEMLPEFGVLLPGQPQRLFLHATLGDKPLAAEFVLTGHGLSARVRTNPRGWGEVVWNLPAEVGALVPDKVNSGCAGEVAATVHARWMATGSAAAPSIDRCLRVDRDAVAAVRPGSPMAKAGEALPVRILGAKGSASVLLKGPGDGAWQSTWIGDAGRGGKVVLPSSAIGEWTLGAAGVAIPKNKNVQGGGVLVLPRVLPRLSVTREKSDGIAPGDRVVVEAVLDDGHGRPLVGSVGAVVFDKAGGTHPERLLALDTRRSLAAPAGIADQDVDAFLDGDSRFEIERWAAVAKGAGSLPAPAFDPAATVSEEIDKVFRQVVQSLEGAVYESSSDPERLRDARVRTATGFALNPELLTLATEAMDEPPLTPGGEPWRLSDLMAIDGQVNFDHVARRVTRLKLFHLLAKLRDFVHENKLGVDEPALHDPNALLRRMVRSEAIEAGALLDPWGHGMTFVRSAGPRIPFLSVVPGYRLLSAGPDGRFGTADDVQDPFQRVLVSKTPYASAVEEDRLVDAKWDMRVSDETVQAWTDLLQELTGRTMGDQSGQGYGSGGLGSLSGNEIGSAYGAGGRGSTAIDPGSAHWLPPVRTDERGHVHLTVPLGDAETTWQIVLVAMPDQGLPAVSSVDVTTALPLSVRVATGASWMVGDVVNVPVRLRNRTEKAVTASLLLSASGTAQILDVSASKRTISVPAQSMVTVAVRIRGSSVGTATLDAAIEGAGLSDRLKHVWAIQAAGETFIAQNVTWVEQGSTVALPAGSQSTPVQGTGRLVLERGIAPVLAAALDSLQPDHLTGERAFADALEVFGRVRSWAIVRGGESHALAVRARELARQVPEHGRLLRAKKADHDWEKPLLLREQFWQSLANPTSEWSDTGHFDAKCPPRSPSILEAFDWLAIAPRSDRGSESACWAALRTSVLNQLSSEKDPLILARAVLSFLDSPSKAVAATALADRLAAAAPVRSDGTLVLPAALPNNRSARAIVLAALARSAPLRRGQEQPNAATLWPRLLVERDDRGGYGSAEATRQVVRALLENGGDSPSPAAIRCTELSAKGKKVAQRDLTLAADNTVTLPLTPDAASVRIETSAPGLLARAQRPLFRSFFLPTDPAASPIHLDLAMPQSASKEGLGSMQVSLRHDLDRSVSIMVRIPLPPGAVLAEKIASMWQVQGVIYVRTSLDSDSLPRVIPIPLRFTLSGTVTMPEATARVTDDEVPIARTPARPLTVGEHS
jgi:Alpha-2-macroglobulin family